jgi:hypothetical protein
MTAAVDLLDGPELTIRHVPSRSCAANWDAVAGRECAVGLSMQRHPGGSLLTRSMRTTVYNGFK